MGIGTWILLFVIAVGIGIAVALVNPWTERRASAPATDRPAAPGWYADPAGSYDQRYWDGDRWTDQVTRDGQQLRSPLARGIGRLGGGRRIAGPPGRPRPPTRP